MMTMKYDFVPDETDATLDCIRILEGKYKGLIYQYGTVSFNENESEENASLSFNYRVVEEVEDSDPDELQEILGDILMTLLNEHVEDIEKANFSVKHEEVENDLILEHQIKKVKNTIKEERANAND